MSTEHQTETSLEEQGCGSAAGRAGTAQSLELEVLQRDNAELMRLAQRLVQDGEDLLASRTWRIGYALTQLLRKGARLLGLGLAGQHITPGHFRRLAEECQPLIRAEAGSYVINGKLEDIPSSYLPMDVDDALSRLWQNMAGEEPNDA